MTETEMGLLIGTYTEKLAHVDGKAAGILSARLADGVAEGAGVAAKVRNPSWLSVTRDGTRVFAVVETVEFEGQPGGGVVAYARDRDTGALTGLGSAPSAGVEPAHLALSPDERHLLVANYRTGSVSVFRVEDDGRIGAMVEHVQHEGSSVHEVRQTGPHAHQILFDPATGLALVPDLGLDAVLLYAFDPATGKLAEQRELRIVGAPGAGPRHLAFHPDGVHLFLLNELDNTLVLLRRTGDGGKGFVAVTTTSTLPSGFAGHSQGSEIRIASDGRLVLTSNRGDLDSIAVFEFDAAAERLELAQVEPSRGAEPRDFIVTPDGAHLLVANQNSDSLVTFELAAERPHLRYVASTAAPTPVCLVPVP